MSNDDIMAMGRYIYYSGDSNDLAVRTNFESNFPSIPALMSKNNPYNGNSYYVVIGLDTSYKANDDYAQAYTCPDMRRSLTGPSRFTRLTGQKRISCCS